MVLDDNALLDIIGEDIDVVDLEMKRSTAIDGEGLVGESEDALEVAVDVFQAESHPAADRETPFVADILKSLLLLTPPVLVTVHVAGLEVEQALDGITHGRSDGNEPGPDVQPRSAYGCDDAGWLMNRTSPQRPRSRTEMMTGAFSAFWPRCRRREANCMKLRAEV